MTSTEGQQPAGLAEVIAETIRQWRSQNPTATAVPRSVRRQISQAIRTDTRTHQLDAAITRNQVELAILHHQKDVLTHQHQGNASDDEWGRQQQRLHDSAVKLESWIHGLPYLNQTERGQAIRGLMQAHTAVKLDPGPGMVALKARVTERFSAIRLGLREVTSRSLRSMSVRVAAWQADRREMEAQRPEGPLSWLTPAQSSALADLTTAAQRWQAGAEQAQAAKESGTDLAALIANFNDALTFTRQIGVSPERINQELVAAHTDNVSERRQGMWSKIQEAARGPLTPPAAAAAPAQPFAFGSAPAAQSAPLAAAARRAR